MIRVVLVLLAILIAVLALVFEQWWLYAIAGVALATALAVIWRSFAPSSPAPASSPAERPRESTASQKARSDEPMEQFGIVSIRPQDRKNQQEQEKQKEDNEPEAASKGSAPKAPAGSPSADEASSDDASSTESASTPASPSRSVSSRSAASSDDASASTTPAAKRVASPPAPSPSPDTSDASDRAPANDTDPASTVASTRSSSSSQVEESTSNGEDRSADRDPLLNPYLQALRTALRARVAAFVVQEDVALEYRIKAIEGGAAVVPPGDTFTTREPLLTASTAHQPVTVHNVDAQTDREQLLGYDRAAEDVHHLVLAPLTRRESHDFSFLLVDGSEVLDTSRSRTLLERFADTLALVLDYQVKAPEQGDTTPEVPELNEDELIGRDTPVADASRVAVNSDPSPEEPVEETSDDDDVKRTPRPRSEIIAEEMEAAYTSNREMALVLVHLNRAEALGRQGDGMVRRGEERLRSYLQKRAPESRVTRFGELTYGVFVHEPLEMVGPWALDMQDDLDYADGLLKGGASIGVAVWNHHDPPDVFRANATEALREAYITGDCTLIE